jgi:hypothetical protein
MELIYRPEGHSYSSINDPEKPWISVTTFLGFFKEAFNQKEIAEKCSKNKKSKWYGLPVERIIGYWNKEEDRANTLGKWYHGQREEETGLCETIRREGMDLPIFRPALNNDGTRISPPQQLSPGIYPEHFLYLKSAGICGQADRVEVLNDTVNIYDYKTNKKIEKEGYTNWEGITKKMLHPLEHLDDCNFVHYALQLSFYLYIILKHNHNLKPGILTLQHVTFEVEDTDELGYPILASDIQGDPIVKEVIPYEVPYLRKEVISLINYIKLNPQILKNDKTV